MSTHAVALLFTPVVYGNKSTLASNTKIHSSLIASNGSSLKKNVSEGLGNISLLLNCRFDNE